MVYFLPNIAFFKGFGSLGAGVGVLAVYGAIRKTSGILGG